MKSLATLRGRNADFWNRTITTEQVTPADYWTIAWVKNAALDRFVFVAKWPQTLGPC
jgi:hypothetical protein